MIRKTSIFLGVVLLAAAAAAAQEKIQLRQAFKPGRYLIQTTMASVNRTAQGADTIRQGVDLELGLDLDVMAADANGVRKMAMQFRLLHQKVSVNERVYKDYDSRLPWDDTDPVTAGLKAMMTAKITFEMTSDGKVRNMAGLDECWDPMVKIKPGMAGVAEDMKRQFGASMVEKLLSDPAKSFAPSPVVVGDTWKASTHTETPTVGDMKVDQDCKLLSVDDGPMGPQAVIEISAAGATDKAKTTKLRDQFLTVERAGTTQKVTMKIDLATGLPMSVKAVATTTMDLKMVSAAGDYSKISPSQDLKSETTIVPAPAAGQPAKDSSKPSLVPSVPSK